MVMPPEKDDPLMVERVKHTSTKAYQLLKTALGIFGQICTEIRRIYCNADADVERFFVDSRKFQKSERVKPAESKSPTRAQHGNGNKASLGSSSPVVRPTTAPTKMQSHTSLHPEVRIIKDDDDGLADDDDHEEDVLYEEDAAAASSSMPKSRRSSSFAESVGEEIDDLPHESSSHQHHQEEELDEEIAAAESANEASEIESDHDQHHHHHNNNNSNSGSGSGVRKKSSSVINTSYSESKAGKSQAGYESYTDDTDHDDQQRQQQSGTKSKKKTSKKKKAKRKKQIVKAFLDKNELMLAKMPDTKMQEKYILDTILADHSRQVVHNNHNHKHNTNHEDTSSPSNLQDRSQTAEEEKWNKYPCCYCGKRFRGVGKIPPSIANTDKAVRDRAKSRAKKEHSLYADFQHKVTLGDDYSTMRRTFLQQIEESTKSSSSHNTDKVFCSWVCVKRWTVHCCPMQMKYQNEMLIDMAAGYAVPI
jgi:hypothetical protein